MWFTEYREHAKLKKKNSRNLSIVNGWFPCFFSSSSNNPEYIQYAMKHSFVYFVCASYSYYIFNMLTLCSIYTLAFRSSFASLCMVKSFMTGVRKTQCTEYSWMWHIFSNEECIYFIGWSTHSYCSDITGLCLHSDNLSTN